MSERPDARTVHAVGSAEGFERALADLHTDTERRADAAGTSLEDVLARAWLSWLVTPSDGGGDTAAGSDPFADPAAFGQLFDRYHDHVFRFVLDRLGDRAAAEDLTQEVFVRAYRRIAAGSRSRDLGAWFVTIARDLVADHRRASPYPPEQPTVPAVPAGTPSTDSTDLLRLVAALPEDEQECLALRFLQGLSVAETAAITGRTVDAVRTLQHRAVRRLARLRGEDPGSADR